MSSMLCLEISLVSLMLYHDARQCAVVCSVAASAWFLCSVLSVPSPSCLEIPLVFLMLYGDARQCAEVCSVAASAWFLCRVLSVSVTIMSGDPISIPDVVS